ncbi:MAG: MBL fold metallo-hydrolase [Cyclobacteriaceae bacterium]|jgi:cyclase|nr:MBL fold metallo-hydrolase [Cyclobacteriaceae bacterium]
MKALNLTFFLSLFVVSAMAQTNYDTIRIVPIKVTEQIYMLKGSGGNIGVLIGTEGTLMIDNQFAPLSNKINGAIKTLSPGEIKFALNTHVHGDHSGGNENFNRMGAVLVAHDNVRERMMKEQVNTSTNRTTPPRDKEAWPLITFADKINFHLNGEDIILHHFDKGHTDGDVIVQFKNANVVHTGDAFVRYGYPYIDLSNGGSINGFINTLDKILALIDDNTKVIPGHGELATKADVKKVRDGVADIRDQVAAALKKGTKIENMTSLGITDKYEREWGRGFVKGKDFVLVVAESLSGK